jgi:hypothetical protein
MYRLVRRIRSWWPRRSEELLFDPFIAASDFLIGEKLCVYGDYLYRYDPTGQLPPIFIARQNIKAGQKVISDPTSSRSDLTVILWNMER